MRWMVVVLGGLILFSIGLGEAKPPEGRAPRPGQYLSIPPLEGRSRSPTSPVPDSPRDPPWIPNIKVSDDPGAGSQNETSMGIFGQNLFMGWNDNRMGVYHIGFSYSTNSGDTWAANQILNEPAFPQQADPSVAVDDSGYVYMGMISYNTSTWESDVFVAKSTDGGQTWGTPTLVSPNTPTSFEDKDWVTANGESLYVSFASFNSDVDIRFALSTNRGETFLPHVQVNDNPVPCYHNGSMPVSGPGGEIYVSWGMDDRTSPEGIYVAKSIDGGASFGPNVRVADQYFTWANTPWRMTGIPVMAVSQTNGDVYIVWNDTTYGNLDIFFSRSTDGGTTFSAPIVVNDNPPGDPSWQFMPWLTVDPFGDIHAVWYDTRSGGLNIDVYYSRSTDRGQSFEPNLRVTDQATVGTSFIGDYIAIVTDSTTAYCAWSDNRNSNQDAYFSRYPYVGIEEEAKSQIPITKSRLLQNHPNPFSHTTLITYSVPSTVRRRRTAVSLSIYDLSGRVVRDFTLPTTYSLLPTSVVWDGRDTSGRILPTGAYFASLKMREQTATNKMILVR